MKKMILAVLCFVGIVSQAYAGDSDKVSLVLMPINGVNLLVSDILDRENIKADNTVDVAVDDSFENFKKKQQEEFDAFKRGGPGSQAMAARKRADAKMLADRTESEEKRLQTSLQWALRDGLQNHFQVFSGEDHSDAKLVATGSVTKRDYGYFLDVSIKNTTTNKIVYANSSPCHACNEIQVGIKFKDMGNAPAPVPALASVEPDSPNTPPPQNANNPQSKKVGDIVVTVRRIQVLKGNKIIVSLEIANQSDNEFKVAVNSQDLPALTDEKGNQFEYLGGMNVDVHNGSQWPLLNGQTLNPKSSDDGVLNFRSTNNFRPDDSNDIGSSFGVSIRIVIYNAKNQTTSNYKVSFFDIKAQKPK